MQILVAEGLGDSTFLKHVNANPNDPKSKTEFLRWTKARNTKTGLLEVSPGLVRREQERQIHIFQNNYNIVKPIYKDILVFAIVALLSGTIGWIIKPCPTCLGQLLLKYMIRLSCKRYRYYRHQYANRSWKKRRNIRGRQNYSYTSNTNKINCLVLTL